MQARHVRGTKEYKKYAERLKSESKIYEPSYLTDEMAGPGTGKAKKPYAELQRLVYAYAGTGTIRCMKTGDGVQVVEYLDMPREIGYTVSKKSGKATLTKRIQIRYAMEGIHIVLDKEV